MPNFATPLSIPAVRQVTPPWRRHLLRADRQMQEGRPELAVGSLKRAIAAGADAYECTLRIAELYRHLEYWPLALAAAEQAVSLAPRRLLAYEAIIAISLETGNFERAIETSGALIKLAPRHLLAHSALGVAYMQMGEIDAAMRATNNLIRLDPLTPAHHFKKALLCQHKEEIALAVEAFTHTIVLDPDGPYAAAAQEALETLDNLQLNQILTLAMEDRIFRVYLQRNPPEAAAERGFVLSELGNHILTEICNEPMPESHLPSLPQCYN